MTEKRELYHCPICGNLVEVLNNGAGTLVCCGKPMSRIEGNTTDGDRLWAVLAESLEGSHGAIINIGESSISDWFTPDRLGELSDYLKNLIDAA